MNRDVTRDRLMAQDGVNTDAVLVPIYRDHVPWRGLVRRVIVATSICRQRDRDTQQRQLDLSHAHADINGKLFDE